MRKRTFHMLRAGVVKMLGALSQTPPPESVTAWFPYDEWVCEQKGPKIVVTFLHEGTPMGEASCRGVLNPEARVRMSGLAGRHQCVVEIL